MNLLSNSSGRTALFTLLYLSEGAPIGFIWWALPTLLRTEDVAIDRITSLTALLVLPWVLKVLWAPLVDALRGARWGLRSWIITAQILMGVALLPLVWLDPARYFGWWKGLLLLHAFAAATQDVAIDALAIRTVPESQRGMLNGCMQGGMLIGRSLFGGVALLVAGQWGWHWIIVGLIVCVWSSLAAVFLAEEPDALRQSSGGFQEFFHKGKEVLRLRNTWLGLGFALIAGAGFESVGALSGPYLVDQGIASEHVGLFYGLPVVFATMTGGLLGGYLADRNGARRIIGGSIGGLAMVILLLAFLDWRAQGAPKVWTPVLLLVGMYFLVGIFTASSYALFMNLTTPALGATQFSAYMAATNGCESWSAWAGGRLAASGSYGLSFSTMSLVSLLGLVFLPLMRLVGRRRRETNTQ